MIIAADIAILEQLEPLGVEFSNECKLSEWAGGPFNWTHFVKAWQRLLEAGMGKIFVAISRNKPAGAIGIVLFDDPLTGNKMAQEAFWFVSSENRGQGVRLLAAAEKWCQGLGVKQLFMMALAHLNAEALDKLYRHRGYLPMEMVYRKAF